MMWAVIKFTCLAQILFLGVFKALKQAIDDDDLYEEELIWQVIEMTEKEEGGKLIKQNIFRRVIVHPILSHLGVV